MNAMLQPEVPLVGVFFDEPADVYYRRALGEASNSALTVIDEQTPRHYWHWVHHPEDDESTTALTFGKAFHTATLEPEIFGDLYTVLPADAPRDLRHLRDAQKPSDSTKRAIEWWDSWTAHSASRAVLTRADYDLALAMAASLRAYEMAFKVGGHEVSITAGELFDACRKEVTFRWIDEDTGLPCKSRMDVYEADLQFGGDLKSCLDGSRAAFSRAINRHRYHVQHGHYCEGARVCGVPLRSFAFFPVEKCRPHVPASWHVDAPSEARGWDIRQRSMRKLARCMETNTWPGHTTTVEPIGIPAYGHYDADKDQT
jgi:hypothetical protein